MALVSVQTEQKLLQTKQGHCFKALVLTINHPCYEAGSYNWNIFDIVVMIYKEI